jgi:hypothetical protein
VFKFGSLRQVQNTGKELGRDITVEQPIAVLAEYVRIPNGVVGREPNQPTEQQTIVELLHQLPFRAHRLKRRQEQRAQQPLRRNRCPPFASIEPIQPPRQLLQCSINQCADRPQRMVRRNASLQTHVADESFRSLIFAAEASREKAVRVVELWKEQLARDPDLWRWSPTIMAAAVAGIPWMDVYCPGCGTTRTIDNRSGRRWRTWRAPVIQAPSQKSIWQKQ